MLKKSPFLVTSKHHRGRYIAVFEQKKKWCSLLEDLMIRSLKSCAKIRRSPAYTVIWHPSKSFKKHGSYTLLFLYLLFLVIGFQNNFFKSMRNRQTTTHTIIVIFPLTKKNALTNAVTLYFWHHRNENESLEHDQHLDADEINIIVLL